ncbi:MFS transporter [Micromonospora sp. NBRC 101691]|uniref:MFS transporter n=1 Tax=Micromonospora sp. NBRC 101691 TaxID=3032198 RepID=UPI00255732B2|nr:MFS transporter [Micromonospora sp. NBRC 101691]
MSTQVPPLRRNQDFLLLWTGTALSNLGSHASAVAYPLLVLALTGSPADAGLTGFVALLPQLLLQLPAGVLVDRCNRKQVMIWADVLRALALGSLVLALLAGRLSLPHILAVGFIEGSLAVCYRIAAAAAIPNVVHSSQLTAAMSRSEIRVRGSAMLGQPLGGLLFGLGRAVPFLFDILTYALSLVTLLLIRKDLQSDRGGTRRQGGFTEGLAWLWRQPFLRTTTLVVAGSNLLFGALFLVLIVIADDLGASPSAVGVMLGIGAVGGVLGSLLAPAIKSHLSMRVIVVGANWAWALLLPLLLLAPGPYWIGAIFTLMSFIGPIWNIAISSYQLAITPDRIQGRVLGASGMIAMGGVPIGPLAGGFLLEQVGATTSLWLLAAWMLALAVVATVSPSVRHAPALPSAVTTGPQSASAPAAAAR